MMRILCIFWLAVSLGWATQAMLPGTFSLLEGVQDLMGEERYSEASDRLTKAAEDLKRRPYDLAFVHHTHAYIYLATDRYEEAAKQFEKALSLEQLPENTTAATLIALGQIHLMQENPDRALAALARWEALGQLKPAPIGYLLIASAYLEQEAYAQAYEPLKKAIALSEDPPASYLVTLASLCLELGYLKEAVSTYQALLDRYGPQQGSYWMGLASAYLMQENEAQALDAMQAALAAGVLRSDLERLWRLQIFSGVPMRAARLMQSALDGGTIEPEARHYELLFHAYRLAKETSGAIDALQKGLELPGGDQLAEPLASAAMAAYRFDLAIEAADRALAGEAKNPATLWVIKATAHYEKQQIQKAIDAFEQARAYESHRQSADRWIGYLRTL